MSDGQITVKYDSIDQVLADIRAIQNTVAQSKSIDLGFAQSKGYGKDGLNRVARAVVKSAEELEELCMRTYAVVESARDSYESADASGASAAQGIGR
jgi:hypothetical protein